MATPPADPDDTALEAYVASRLRQIGSYFAELHIVRETITDHRDLWVNLYRLDDGAAGSVSPADS